MRAWWLVLVVAAVAAEAAAQVVEAEDPVGDLLLEVAGHAIGPLEETHPEADLTYLRAQRHEDALAFTVGVRELRDAGGTWGENSRIDIHFTIDEREHRARLHLNWCVFCSLDGLTGSVELQVLSGSEWLTLDWMRGAVDGEADRFHLDLPWDSLRGGFDDAVEKIHAYGIVDGDDVLWATRWQFGDGALPVRAWDRVPDEGHLRLAAPASPEVPREPLGPERPAGAERPREPQGPERPGGPERPREPEASQGHDEGSRQSRETPGPALPLLLAILARRRPWTTPK